MLATLWNGTLTIVVLSSHDSSWRLDCDAELLDLVASSSLGSKLLLRRALAMFGDSRLVVVLILVLLLRALQADAIELLPVAQTANFIMARSTVSHS